MYLKRIELNGFKSFPHKKEIHINDGITGVVGPNGSGKSNIADAMRWVLGEQSSKNLRGSTMQDVIFNGTQSRPKKGYCEVSLIFDNEDGKVNTEYSEVCVRRKMYRSGESEYSINNSNCRLKDILELFRDTGIGKEGYSIIGQGRIDELLNSKAVQRRRVFEEAAGIMKYRVRKEEAERNLAKTKENIVRLDDIVAELEIQVGPLEAQMREAKNYISLRDRLKELEVNLFLYNYDKSIERMQKADQQIVEFEQEYEDITKQIEQISEAQTEIKRGLAGVQGEIDAHNASVGDLLRNQEKAKGDYALEEEKEKNCIKTQQDNDQKCSETMELMRENQEKVAEISKRIQQINETIDNKAEHIAGIRTVLEAMSGEAQTYGEQLEQLKAEAENVRTELQGRRLELNESTIKTEILGKKSGELEQRQKVSQTERKELEARVVKYKAGLEELDQGSEMLRQKSNAFAQDLLRQTEAEEKLQKSLRVVTKGLDEDRSRVQLLTEMREGYEGYFDSVRSLFQKAKERQAVHSKLQGVLAELIDVPKEYELALEIILGNALQNVVVDTDSDAKDVISFLREHEIGRVTFLPARSLRVNYLKKHEQELLSEHGVIGVASEVVGCADEIRPAVDFLLARTVIVQDMESAIALMRKADYSFRTVTMDGDFINPGGAITGGGTKRQKTSLLSRKRMIEELEKAVKEKTAEKETLKKQIEEIGQSSGEIRNAQKVVLEQLREQEIATAEMKMKLRNVEKLLEEKTVAIEALLEEQKQTALESVQLTGKAKEDEEAIEALQAGFEELTERQMALERQMSESAQKNAERREELRKLEIEQAEFIHQKTILLNDAEHMRAAIAQAEETVGAAVAQNEALKQELIDIRRRKTELMEKLDDAMTALKNSDVLIEDKIAERDRLNVLQEENEHKAADLTERKSLLIEQKYRLASTKEKTELAKETAQNKLWEDYGLTYANALEMKTEEFAFQNSSREIEEIRGKIREMGAVNPNAIEDYTRVRERYDHLVTQRADLVKAGEDLEIVIGELLNGMTASFREKFGLINSNFQRVFQELFGGGHAELELLDDNDIMECGIEIIAEPPGKRLQNIQLLSGGEKALTAIALLFAMLAINPSPICLLDEIDAPLDDANLIRLADYLTRLSSKLQFIVITHRKPTMAICDTLYGIAMHEKGVSDVVSVKLENQGA